MPLSQAQEFHLPAPGEMVPLSPSLDPPMLMGIKVHPDNPFAFDFVLDRGDSKTLHDGAGENGLKQEASRLIKYFLASLTVPEKDLWVNLSPYEKDRIIPQSFGQTEMGRDLLAEDYILKQVTASLIYPQGATGKRFWERVYAQAAKKYGTTNIPVSTFNKVWIVPEKADVYENVKTATAYVVESKLKVMLEKDYLSMQKHLVNASSTAALIDTSSIGENITREIVIPELTREVNENRNFAQLRQVYNSLILATWYKKKIKSSILAQVYEDKNKVAGVGYKDSLKTAVIYQRYLEAFKKGVFNLIKEEPDPLTQEMIPRKYFSGGVSFAMTGNTTMKGIDGAMKVTEATDALRKVFRLLNPKRLFVVKDNMSSVATPLVYLPVNVPQGYRLLGGQKDPWLAARLQRTTGLTSALIGPRVYSPIQDNELTLKFLDIIGSYIDRLEPMNIKNNELKVLVIGSGSGLDALTAFHQAKLRGFKVKIDAVDIKDEAVENITKNFELVQDEKTVDDAFNVLKIAENGGLQEITDKYDLVLFNAPDAVPKAQLLNANEDIQMDQEIFQRILHVIADRLLSKNGMAIVGNQRSILDPLVIVNGKLRYNQTSLIPKNLNWNIVGTSEEGVYLKGQEESRVFFELTLKNPAMTIRLDSNPPSTVIHPWVHDFLQKLSSGGLSNSFREKVTQKIVSSIKGLAATGGSADQVREITQRVEDRARKLLEVVNDPQVDGSVKYVLLHVSALSVLAGTRPAAWLDSTSNIGETEKDDFMIPKIIRPGKINIDQEDVDRFLVKLRSALYRISPGLEVKSTGIIKDSDDFSIVIYDPVLVRHTIETADRQGSEAISFADVPGQTIDDKVENVFGKQGDKNTKGNDLRGVLLGYPLEDVGLSSGEDQQKYRVTSNIFYNDVFSWASKGSRSSRNTFNGFELAVGLMERSFLLRPFQSGGAGTKANRSSEGDKAMSFKNTGGIDFTANKTPLKIQNAGEGIKFKIDPAMIAQFQRSQGFIPVVISVKPLGSLQGFLGISTDKDLQIPTPV